uniref:Fatty acyl-CoA reductase n=1 Tax=Lygus hesperus TaxID=30085 RepID=A0A0A9WZV0_LYGHE
MRVKDYYKGKNVLVTGVTGLMGKALVEKLLRSCPEVGNIYCIVRTKRGQDPQERWTQTTNSMLFDQLKEKNPESLSKVIVLPGESTAECFGLSEEHQKLLVENVNIVYHGAASINFAESIVSAVKLNMKNTFSLLELSRRMKKLELFVHVSTAYSNFPRKGEIKEEVYESHLSWRHVLELVEDECGCETLLHLQPKLLNGHKSNYTLTKGLSENMVNDYNRYFPVMIVRPSLITGIYKDPVPGWLDMDNFISLICKGVRMGVLRVILCDKSREFCHIPLDLSIKAMIVAPWKKSLSSKKEVDVICCQMDQENHQNKMTFHTVHRVAYPMSLSYPDKQAMWYPFSLYTTNPSIYHVLFLILHIFPAYFIDMALKLSGRDPQLLKVYSSIWALFELNKYYVNPHHWFSTSNYKNLEESLLEEDKDEFSMATSDFDPENFIHANGLHVVKHHWKEAENSVNPEVLARLRRFKVAHYTLCSVLAIGVSYQAVQLLQSLM